jgi:large subunit ribosomal protein L4
MPVQSFTKNGTLSTSAIKLPKDIFEIEVKNHELLRQVYVAEQANRRVNLAFTKTRGEVRGGGRKPWRQKGTGRARFGSIRNPIWRGGGIVFGPRAVENYSKKVNRGAKVKALKQALTLAHTQNRISIIEAMPTTGKTKDSAGLIKKIQLSRGLIIVDELTPDIKRATKNIPTIEVIAASHLSTSHVLNSQQLLFEKKALDSLAKKLEIKS